MKRVHIAICPGAFNNHRAWQDVDMVDAGVIGCNIKLSHTTLKSSKWFRVLQTILS